MFLGLWQANAPRWMAAALGAGCVGALAAFAALEARGRRVSTYSAIWGPEAEAALRRGAAPGGARDGG